jgi:hypothetical protein
MSAAIKRARENLKNIRERPQPPPSKDLTIQERRSKILMPKNETKAKIERLAITVR